MVYLDLGMLWRGEVERLDLLVKVLERGAVVRVAGRFEWRFSFEGWLGLVSG